MALRDGFNRRAFLRSVPAAAIATGINTPAASAFDDTTAKKYDFDTPYNRVGTDSIKWDRQIRVYGKENVAVGMGIADMDFRVAPCITKALDQRIQHENWGYLDTPRSFVDAIVNWNRKRYGIEINPDLLVLTTGVHPAIISALKTFSPVGSKVLLATPNYDGFYSDIAFCGCQPEEIAMKIVQGRYSIDFEDLERRISHDTNTLILCNPHNPTGNCWSAEDLNTLGEICTRRRVVVLADEIHCDFVTKGSRYVPYSTLRNHQIVRNSITFKAASKSFGLSAFKCGWFFSENADYIARVRANSRQDFNTLGVVANRAALIEGEEWLDQLVSYIDANHDFVESFVRANIPLIKTVKPQGTYLCWLDVSQLSERIGAAKLAAQANQNRDPSAKPITPETILEQWFVKNARVHLNPGSAYGSGGAGHMRMNIGTSRKTLQLALTNIADALKRA
jgi:cystathionine beta-lyase